MGSSVAASCSLQRIEDFRDIGMHTIDISDRAYDLDGIDVQILIENLVRRHAEYIDLFQGVSPETQFSLKR